MALEGALQDVGLADICQLLGMGRKTGCLSITDRSNFGYIYFRHGRVIHASVLNRPDRLGDLLVRNKVITRDQLAKAVKVQALEKRRRLGEILVEEGSVTEEELQLYIKRQTEEAVYHLFTWGQGSFHFDPDQTSDEESIYLVDIAPESLLMEGARRVDEWQLIEKKIPTFDVVFQVDKDPRETDEDIELTDHQEVVLPLVDGVSTVNEILAQSGLGEFDAGKALYGLVQGGYISPAGERSDFAESAENAEEVDRLKLGVAFLRSGMMEDAVRELEAVLEADPDQARAHFMLGLVALRMGRPAEALERFDAMTEESRQGYAVNRNRAVALDLLGRSEEAIAALDVAARAKPEDHDILLLRGMLSLKARDARTALKALGRYRTSPTVRRPSPVYYAYTVLAAAMAADLDHAVAVGREGLGFYPDSGPILVNTGVVLERLGEIEAAEALFKRAVALSQPPAQAHKNLGDQAWARGDHAGARVQYEKAVKLSPRLGDDLFLRLGTIAYREEDRDLALLLWRRALDLNPRNQAVRENLEMLQGQ
jgi:tetratricopeptide (TPR) repeat protein